MTTILRGKCVWYLSLSHSLSKIPFLASYRIIKINITAENEK